MSDLSSEHVEFDLAILTLFSCLPSIEGFSYM
jgi:hypothetical protein